MMLPVGESNGADGEGDGDGDGEGGLEEVDKRNRVGGGEGG
jgi:hypothetical protein